MQWTFETRVYYGAVPKPVCVLLWREACTHNARLGIHYLLALPHFKPFRNGR